MIGGLDSNLWHTILSFVPPEEWTQVSSTNRYFSELRRQKPFWQFQISRYFPYLVPPNNIQQHEITKRQQQFQDNPRALFIEHYQHVVQCSLQLIVDGNPIQVKRIFPEMPIATVLDRLLSDNILLAGAGNNVALDSLNTCEKGLALEFAGWCGSHAAVEMILERPGAGRHIKPEHYGRALENAGRVGNADIVRTLLLNANNAIPLVHKAVALLNAASGGFLDVVVNILALEGVNIPLEMKGSALIFAAAHGHEDVVQILLIQESRVIFSFHKGDALVRACKGGHLAVMNTLLDSEEAQIIAHHKQQALMGACEAGHLDVVTALLERFGNNITLHYMKKALIEAASYGHVNIVEFLLTNHAANFDGSVKGAALRNAVVRGRVNVVEFLLATVGDEISVKDKKSAFRIAADQPHDGCISILLKRCGHEMSFNDLTETLGLPFACSFKAREGVTFAYNALRDISYPGDALAGLAHLPSPMPLKRKASELELSDNEMDVEVDDEDIEDVEEFEEAEPSNKRARFKK